MADTTIPTITFDVALKGIQAAVEDMGYDHVYGRSVCTYVESDADGCRSSCIVGHFLVNTLGIDPETFIELDINQGYGVVGVAGQLRRRGIIEGMTKKALRFLVTVQVEQDARVPWGEALERGMKYAKTAPLSDDILSA